MLAHTVHDVRITNEIRSLPSEDGWARHEATGQATLTCSCGHTDGPMAASWAPTMAKLHIINN